MRSIIDPFHFEKKRFISQKTNDKYLKTKKII